MIRQKFGNNHECLHQKLYNLCKKIAEHPLNQVEKNLILHHTIEEFRRDIGLHKSNRLLQYGSNLRMYLKQNGEKLEDGFRLSFEKEKKEKGYLVTISGMTVPLEQYDSFLDALMKKKQAFDRTYAFIEKRAQNEAETDSSLQEVMDNYQFTWQFYHDNKSSFTRSPIKFARRKEEICHKLLDNYMGLQDDENLKIWESVDISTLILIILDALPAYGKSTRSYHIDEAFSTMLKFMQKYHQSRSRTNESEQIMSIKEKIDSGHLVKNKFSLITTLQKIIDELWAEVSPAALTEQNDSLLYGHRQFCESYNIQGVWLDEKKRYWSIRETGDYCLLYHYELDFKSNKIIYTKYTLIANEDNEDSIITFNIRETSNVLRLFRGEKLDVNRIDELKVELEISKTNKRTPIKVNCIHLESMKFHSNLFCFNTLNRASSDEEKYLKNKWDSYEKIALADYNFFRSMVAITSEHIYVGSFERDERGRHQFFYQISKDNVDSEIKDHLYYVDFNQSVGVYKVQWLEQNQSIIKYYLSIDSKAIYIDIEDIKKQVYAGIRIIDEPRQVGTIQNFVGLDQEGEEILTVEDIESYSSPFYFLTK